MQGWLNFSRNLTQGLREFGDTWGLTIALCLVAVFVGLTMFSKMYKRNTRNRYYQDYIKRKRS